MTLPPSMKVRLREAIAREPSRTRAAGTRRIAWLAASAAAALVAILATLGGPRLAGRPYAFVVASALAWSAAAALATWFALTRGRSIVGRPLGTLLLVMAGTPLAFVALKVLCTHYYLGDHLEVAPLQRALPCLLTTLALGAWPLVAFTLAWRESDPVHPRALGGALGLAAGTWAGVAIDLHCGISDLPHVVCGHVLPLVLLTAAGLLAGRFVGMSRTDPRRPTLR